MAKNEAFEAAVAAQVKMHIGCAFIFEREADGTRGVTLKSSPRRKGFTVGLTDLTPETIRIISKGVEEFLLMVIDPGAQEWVDSKVKSFAGYPAKK